MADVGVISFLHNDNYGSTLQAWAMQQTLSDLGLTPVHLNYRPDSVEKVLNQVRSGNSLRVLSDSLKRNSVKRTEPGAVEKAAAFRAFQRESLHLTAPCRNKAELRAAAKDCPLLICGSDQIWSPEWLNPVYFLNFAGPGQRKAAYACSLGVSALPAERKQRLMRRLVEGFDAVSLREEEGLALLRRIAPDCPACVMPDPVFLVTPDRWQALASPPKQRGGMVCYLMGDAPANWERVAALSKSFSRTTLIPVSAQSYHQPYHQEAGKDPRDWLGLLLSADHVCTDSFHGAAFAVLLGIPVTILRRYRDGESSSKNSRIDQLLRHIGHGGDDTVLPDEKTRQAVERLRKMGRSWLKEQIVRVKE
ncbi:MAG: polysaccharide pyruvyl transferase family protein [Clostridia bacterium]|nr:polysaccharide pyruvyl transferase family protein [Clostridia bacterium]